MIFKNLFRRKGRTILTLLGISIGVAAIVALGAMAEGLRAGYTAMASGSQADLVRCARGADWARAGPRRGGPEPRHVVHHRG
jgi:hypothetical protein